MTSFTTEDRMAAEATEKFKNDRVTVMFLNLIDDCHRTAARVDADTALQLKLVANRIAEIGNKHYLK
jgi:hypothetical protein